MSALTKQAAEQLLFEQIHVPAFQSRLAQHGIVPRTVGELQTMLKTAGDLHRLHDMQQTQPQPNSILEKFAAHVAAAAANPTITDNERRLSMAKQAAQSPQVAAAIQVFLQT